jgi:hypothetical protein
VHGKPVFVLGPKAGLAYLAAQGAEGVVIVEKDGRLTGSLSPGLSGLALDPSLGGPRP